MLAYRGLESSWFTSGIFAGAVSVRTVTKLDGPGYDPRRRIRFEVPPVLGLGRRRARLVSSEQHGVREPAVVAHRDVHIVQAGQPVQGHRQTGSRFINDP